MAVKGIFLNRQEQRQRTLAAVFSLVISVVILAIKFRAYMLTQSQSVFSDAVETIVNVIAAGIALFVIAYSAKPKDEDHPYGHGKAEFFSAAFEGGLITFASLVIVVETVQAWWRGKPLLDLSEGLIWVAVAGLVNLVLGMVLTRVGRKVSSVALRASGAHVISDLWTSAAVVIGLLLVQQTGLVWIDSALAVAVGLWLGFNGFKLVRESSSALMDREDPKILESLTRVFSECFRDGIIQIHNVRVIRSGWYHHIDVHLVMPEFWNVGRVHEVVNQFEKSVIRNYEYGGELNYHVDPCRRAYCRVCAVGDCPIRVEAFEKAMPVDLKQLRSPIEPAEFRGRRKAKET